MSKIELEKGWEATMLAALEQVKERNDDGTSREVAIKLKYAKELGFEVPEKPEKFKVYNKQLDREELKPLTEATWVEIKMVSVPVDELREKLEARSESTVA